MCTSSIDIGIDYLDHIDKIKTYEEWEKLNFKLSRLKNNSSLTFKKKDHYYWFNVVDDSEYMRMDDEEEKCFLLNKKITKYPIDIYYLIKQGISKDEFFYYESSMLYYFNALDFYENKCLSEAILSLQKAMDINNRNEYNELLDEINIKLYNTETAEKLFDKYRNDITEPMRLEIINKWLKCFVQNSEYLKCQYYIEFSISQYNKLINDEIEPVIYTKQQKEFSEHYYDNFLNSLDGIFSKFNWKTVIISEELIKLLKYILSIYKGDNQRFINNVKLLFNKNSSNLIVSNK